MHRRGFNARAHAPATDEIPEIIAIVLMVAWLLGMLSGYTWDGAIHVLAAVAAGVMAFRFTHPRTTK